MSESLMRDAHVEPDANTRIEEAVDSSKGPFLHDVLKVKFDGVPAESVFKPTLESARAYFATAHLDIKPDEITALGPNIGNSDARGIYPVSISSMSACEYMRDNYPSLVKIGFNNMVSTGRDGSIGLVYVS